MKSESTVTKTWQHEKKKKPRMCWGLEKYDAPGKCAG